MKNDTFKILNYIAQTLYDKKGFNIMAVDVRKHSSMTDFFVIAEGMVDRHVIALAETIIKELSERGEKPIYVEGLKSGDWIVIDYLEIVIHLLTPDMRDKYRLEELWQAGKIVELEFSKEPVI